MNKLGPESTSIGPESTTIGSSPVKFIPISATRGGGAIIVLGRLSRNSVGFSNASCCYQSFGCESCCSSHLRDVSRFACRSDSRAAFRRACSRRRHRSQIVKSWPPSTELANIGRVRATLRRNQSRLGQRRSEFGSIIDRLSADIDLVDAIATSERMEEASLVNWHFTDWWDAARESRE